MNKEEKNSQEILKEIKRRERKYKGFTQTWDIKGYLEALRDIKKFLLNKHDH